MTPQETFAFLIDAARQVVEDFRARNKVNVELMMYLERAVKAAGKVSHADH